MPLNLNILVGTLAVGSVGISGTYAIEKFALRDRSKPGKGSVSEVQGETARTGTQQNGSQPAAAA